METGTHILHSTDLILIITGIFTGTLARFITLKVDYRQNPTYPNGYFINVVTGFIASALGAVAIPAILAKDFVAVTFLSLAIQQFREIRKLERESLEKLEHTEYCKRGEAYIDGISKTYESRNYISLLTSLTTVLTMKIWNNNIPVINIIIGVIAGILAMYIMIRFISGNNIGDICNVRPGKISVKGSELYVDDIFVTNFLGLDRSREMLEKEGIAIVIKPKDEIFRITLECFGQRQAILFEAVRTFGVKRYKFTRRSFETGEVVIAFVPIIRDMSKLIHIVKNTPVLENSRKVHQIMSINQKGANVHE